MKHKPREIRWSVYCLIVLIVMNTAALIILLAENSTIAQGLMANIQSTLPSLSTEKVNSLVNGILIRRNAFHLFVILCWSFLTYMVYRGVEWSRIVLVVFIILSFVGSIYAFSTTQFVSLKTLAALGWLGRIILLWLLLVPRASREYFKGI